MLFHSLITPKQPGWMEEVDRVIAVIRPTSWKSYTIGDPLSPTTTKYPWRLDDEKLMYPFYEKAVKAGITNLCIHKGLLPKDYETSIPNAWHYATVDDVGKAAKDWPQMNFIIYHAALRAFVENTSDDLAEFERTGYVRWTSDLAAIPEKFGVSNVYAELGSSFAVTAISNPRFCAAFMGTLIKGMGFDHVVWGTDFRFVWLPAMADRSVPTVGNSRRHAEEARFRPARPRRRHGKECNLRLQQRPPLPPRFARRRQRIAIRRHRETKGCLSRKRWEPQQRRLWLRGEDKLIEPVRDWDRRVGSTRWSRPAGLATGWRDHAGLFNAALLARIPNPTNVRTHRAATKSEVVVTTFSPFGRVDAEGAAARGARVSDNGKIQGGPRSTRRVMTRGRRSKARRGTFLSIRRG